MTSFEEDSERRFDRNGHGWPRIPFGGPDSKPVAVPRASSFSQNVFDKFAVTRWKSRRAAVGFGVRPELALAVATAGADDPTVDGLIDEAAAAGGAQKAATLGTSMHSLLERWANSEPVVPPPDMAADWDAIQAVLVDFDVRPVAVEQFVAWGENAAGSSDLFCTTNRTEGTTVLDLKTSASALNAQRLLEMSVQLAIYACHTHTWTGWPGDPVEGPLPGVNQEVALVLHAPMGSGTASMLAVDVEVGLELAELALEVRQARRDPKRAVVALSAAPGSRSKNTVWGGVEAECSALRGRIAALIGGTSCTALRVKEGWPAGLPSLLDPALWPRASLDVVERYIARLESQYGWVRVPPGLLSGLEAAIGRLDESVVEGIAERAVVMGIPNLHNVAFKRTHFDILCGQVWEAEEEALG